MNVKTCSCCKQVKDLSEFNFAIKAKTRYQPICRLCQKEQHRQWRQMNPRKRRASRYAFYGMSIGEYERLLEAQNGKCAICGATKPGERIQHFVVDHDHQTGCIRGLLCNLCNVLLGSARDNPIILESAKAYLKTYSTCSFHREV
jgi:hypothetical protein